MAVDWQVPRSGAHCSGCGRAFAPGDAYQACVYAGAELIERRDFCVTCEPASASAPIGSWRARRPHRQTTQPAMLDREAIFQFFEQLAEAVEEEKQQFRFVLGLLLWRKRVLSLAGTEADESGEVWTLRSRDGRAFPVRRPALTDAQIERLSAQLEQVLTGTPGRLRLIPAEESAGASCDETSAGAQRA